MVREIPFQQVDVFTDTPYRGNPVAVVLDGNDLSTKEMQAIANWTNLSETTFVCRPTTPQADYRLRIFTPNSELPFAGHPTIGSAYAWLQQGMKPRSEGCLVQECGSGLVSIQVEDNKLFLALPEPKISNIQPADLHELANALGIQSRQVRVHARVDVGAVWLTLQLPDADTVLHLRPDQSRLASLTPRGVTGVTVFGFAEEASEYQVEVRSFAPGEGVAEDPVCGSGNGCVATLIREFKLLDERRYVARQGTCVGRHGRVEVRYLEIGSILIGGHAVTCIEGALRI